MRAVEIEDRAGWYNAGGVDGGVAAVVVLFDVLHVDRFLDAGPLIKLAHITGEVRVIGNAFEVAFEMPVIHRIKTNQRGKQSPVGFGDLLAEQISLPG